MADERDLKTGEKIYLDLISHNKPSYRCSNNWILIEDSDTKQKWYFFTNSKGDSTENVASFLKKMKTMKKTVKIIRCDNAGENKTLEDNCANFFEEIKFEYTSPVTPQQNGMVKPYSRMCALMMHTELHKNLKTGIWPECAATATKLKNIMVNPYKEKCAHEKFYGKIPDYAK